MRFGVQSFGTLNSNKDDLSALFKKIRGMGYQLFEPCISFFEIPEFENIWDYEKYNEYDRMLKEAGLKVLSCHIFSKNLFKDSENIKRLISEYGIKQFVLKSPEDVSDENLNKTAMEYMRLADEISELGGEVLIHNEAADIEEKVHGKTVYEHLLDLCLGKVYAQVDAGWAMFGGEDPEKLLWRNAYRVKSLHYKDFSGKEECMIGNGDLDVNACYRFARAMGIPQLGDQDSFNGEVTDELKAVYDTLNGLGQSRDKSISYLNTYNVETGEIKVLHKFDRVIEAPNWRHTAPEMIYNSEGHLYRYNIEKDSEEMIDTGLCHDCNNDHVLSPDERYIAISNSAVTDEEGFSSRIYIVPMEGGEARLVTPDSPSFLHGWSPDGEKVVYLSYRKDDLDPGEHLPNMQVELWLMNSDGSDKRRILSFFGGQGSINVNSGSKDSKEFAFVSYELV